MNKKEHQKVKRVISEKSKIKAIQTKNFKYIYDYGTLRHFNARVKAYPFSVVSDLFIALKDARLSNKYKRLLLKLIYDEQKDLEEKWSE